MRILVVDDEHAVRDALRRALDLAGYDVQIAPAAEPAIGLMRERPPDAIVLDVLMPGMDGIELCRRLRCQWDGEPRIQRKTVRLMNRDIPLGNVTFLISAA